MRNYHGKCENVHGHNYKVRITVAGEQLDEAGLLVDFLEIKRLMGAAIEYLDHRFINDLAPFDEINPSAENIAKYFYDRGERWPGYRRGADRGSESLGKWRPSSCRRFRQDA